MDATLRLFEYKTTAINKMLLNANIIKALVDTSPQFKNNTDEQLNNQAFRDSLLYKQVYPYSPITSQFVDAKSYINVSLGIVNSSKSYIVDGNIRIFVSCHKDLLSTNSGQRHGFIANEIDNMMFHSDGFGIGKIKDKRIEELVMATDYIGVSMLYHITDFSI
jgi:hypothetical protein